MYILTPTQIHNEHIYILTCKHINTYLQIGISLKKWSIYLKKRKGSRYKMFAYMYPKCNMERLC